MSLLKISFVTLFPSMFENFVGSSIIKKAIDNGYIDIEIINFRSYSNDKHQKVDDYQYGGGAGLVLMLQPIVDCLQAIKQKDSVVILTTPKGRTFKQEQAVNFSKKYKHIILISGHYEGFDERIKNYIDLEISIGDYILTGGELPSMVIADSIIRLVEGVISQNSLDSESFNNDLLDYPVYTKPIDFNGYKVPDVLLSGNHQEIAKYRLNQQIEITKLNRPDLYKKYMKEKKENNNGSIKNK